MTYRRPAIIHPSGVEYLGSIPKHWDVRSSRRMFSSRMTRAQSNDRQLTASQRYGMVYQDEYIERTGNKVVLALGGQDAFKHVEPGDFVLSLRSFQGGLEYSPVPGKISPAYNIIAPRRELCTRFFEYLFKSDAYIHELRSTSNQLRDGQSLTYKHFCKVPLPELPVAEQQAIADFLDRETAQIDELIAKQNALIELLGERRKAVITRAVTMGLDSQSEMTSTGSFWFPSIPSHWVLAPSKFGAILIQTGPFGSQVHSSDYVDGGTPLINPAHMVNGEVVPDAKIAVSSELASELGRHLLRVDDIVVARRGELGRAAVVSPISAGALCGTGSALVRLDRRKYIAAYFLTVFGSSQTRDALLEHSVGSTMDNLNADMLSNLRLPCPPVSEQVDIMKHLARVTSAIDALTAKSRGVIRLLQERRSALITAAVTGKIDVRAAA